MEPVAVIDSAYEALNAGDVDGWMAHYTADHFENPLLVASLHDVLAAAGQRKEMLEPCRPIGEEQVECTVRDVNDFHGAAGITITLRERFTVNEDGRISATDTTVISFTQPGYYTFTQTFWSWMEDAHPRFTPRTGRSSSPTGRRSRNRSVSASSISMSSWPSPICTRSPTGRRERRFLHSCHPTAEQPRRLSRGAGVRVRRSLRLLSTQKPRSAPQPAASAAGGGRASFHTSRRW
jgi:hypothetical protein